jgi:23S rRNA (guanosine2251-2'-O)-methyltransferase
VKGLCYCGWVKSPKVYAYGKHAVSEAKKFAAHAVLKTFRDAKEGEFAQISLARLVMPYEKFTDTLQVTPDTCLVLTAGIEDPHNLGAIIRTAGGFGATAVLMPEQGQAPVSTAVLKVSAGMAFRVPLVRIGGYQQTLSDLKKRGFKVVALAGGSKHSVNDEPFAAPTVFILGNEGAGIPNAIKPLCDKTLSIPMHPRCESLNVAAAAAVALASWSAKHPAALHPTPGGVHAK